jgi:hypothetical protein
MGNESVRKCAVQLEGLILIRICSRESGQHMLAKQHLSGVGSDPPPSEYSSQWQQQQVFHWQQVFRRRLFIFRFWALLLTVISFIPMSSFILKAIFSDAPKQSPKYWQRVNHVEKQRHLLASVRL